MRRLILFLCIITINVTAWANDGVYYVSGNQLIPINETEISVKKEVLSITRQREQQKIRVHVYYEFFNPGEEKTLLVGFEAMPPGGAWSTSEEELMNYTTHPNISDFTVNINGQNLKYQVSHVEDKDHYYVNGKFKEIDPKHAVELAQESYFETIPYMFVYHFNATFKKGLNIVEHTYTFDESGFVGSEYCFDYVLTAANRWANNQIDDFTLNLDLGNLCSFDVSENFFKGQGGWTINGIGRSNEADHYGNKLLRFHIQEGTVSYHKKNFHPEGELYVEQPFYINEDGDFYDYENSCKHIIGFDFKKAYTSAIKVFYIDDDNIICDEINADMKKIMRNLPFAYRGYVFKTKMLQDYFESTDWYVANPDYVSDMKDLNEDEKTWVEFWTRQQKH